MTILIDSRERRPWDFDQSREVTLDTGDYSVEGLNTAIERKTQSDFLASITHSRERFERECQRAYGFECEMPILVETPWSAFESGDHRRDVHPNAIEGTVESWSDRYNVQFEFLAGRQAARARAKELLDRWTVLAADRSSRGQ